MDRVGEIITFLASEGNVGGRERTKRRGSK